ncbi:hypothetical protein HAX54_014217 [Datura stramonium]|uniref:Uncharacterized protein n=1 Tax=Datura stramonium TaxID=4076 RepID=A0ABS8RYS1_DATST|nr:hypothetical protein [Datura stramonium]
MEEGGGESRDPHITKCRVGKGEHCRMIAGNLPLGLRVCWSAVGTTCREALGGEVAASGRSGEWLCMRAYTDWVGEDVARGEWGILWRTILGGWIKMRKLLEGCGVGTGDLANPTQTWSKLGRSLKSPRRRNQRIVSEKGSLERRGAAWAFGAIFELRARDSIFTWYQSQVHSRLGS